MVRTVEGDGYHFGQLLQIHGRSGRGYENHVLRTPKDLVELIKLARMLKANNDLDKRSMRFVRVTDFMGEQVIVYSIPKPTVSSPTRK